MSKKIMLVDDDTDIRASMKAILEHKGHVVLEAGSGEECLKTYKDFNPEIIFLDLMMEKQDSGITVCKKIRETNSEIKIFLLSAVGDEAAGTINMQEIGFNGAMSKPVSPEELINLVE